jgi:hypothetical protein
MQTGFCFLQKPVFYYTISHEVFLKVFSNGLLRKDAKKKLHRIKRSVFAPLRDLFAFTEPRCLLQSGIPVVNYDAYCRTKNRKMNGDLPLRFAQCSG